MSQTNFTYNGFEHEFDIFDADSADLFESAMNGLREAEKSIPKDGKISSLVRAQCKMLREFFDDILGENAGISLCGERDNFGNCKDAYVAFLNFIDAQKTEYINSVNDVRGKYGANRAQRRHPATTAPQTDKR